jgi:hypothetical protein
MVEEVSVEQGILRIFFRFCLLITRPRLLHTHLLDVRLRLTDVYKRFVVFCVQCHYSVKSCAAVCGLGVDNCVEVPSDSR